MKEQREKDRLVPEIEKYRALIKGIEMDIVTNDESIQKEGNKSKDLKVRISDLESKKEALREENERQSGTFIKLKDEPVRIGKGNENLKIAVNHLKSELDGLKRDSANAEQLAEHELAEKIKINEMITQLNEENKEKNERYRELEIVIKRIADLRISIENDNTTITAKRYEVDCDIQVCNSAKKQNQEELNRKNNKIDKAMKAKKKFEHENEVIESNFKE